MWKVRELGREENEKHVWMTKKENVEKMDIDVSDMRG